jgi:hypothetical protein
MAARAELPTSPLQMWLRIDTAAPPGGQPVNLYLDTMDDRPITRQDWQHYEIVADVPQTAGRIAFGAFLTGIGKAWIDDASLETVTRVEPPAAERPRAITRRGLVNLLALARLTGYVRHFHPSDEAAATDWDVFVISAVRAVESAPDGAALTQRLAELFRPVAPSLVIVPSGTPAPPAPPADESTRHLQWRHVGFGLSTAQTLYRSERVEIPQRAPVFSAELGGGVAVRVPLSVAVDASGTLPRGSAPAAPAAPPLTRGRFQMTDRPTRLATVILTWNVFQHSYPYFPAGTIAWSTTLSAALQEAAMDQTAGDFIATLRRMVAATGDGQARVIAPEDADLQFTPPVALDWIDGHLLAITADAASGVRPGDVVVAIDGTPAPLMLDAAEAFMAAATPQWRKARAADEILAGPKDTPIRLRVERGEPVERLDLTVTRSVSSYPRTTAAEVIADLQPGVVYVDLARVTPADFTAALPRLAAATGIVFDLRAPPAFLPPEVLFAHLSETPMSGPQLHLPRIGGPDREQTTFTRSGEWAIAPKAPFLPARKIFLTGPRAIGYAESCLAVIQAYKLGEIVGAPTAGTTGTTNRFKTPGDYVVMFTGMKVTHQDGSPLHGVGISPTTAVAPSRDGVAAGRDQVIDRALQLLASP